jgi:hypothetical protein
VKTQSLQLEASFKISLDLMTTLFEPNEFEGISIFPNPSTGIVNISAENEIIKKISLFDFQGKEVTDSVRIKLNNLNSSISMGQLPNGVYLIQVISATGTVKKKITLLR